MIKRRGHLAVIFLEGTLGDSEMVTLATTLQELAADDDIWVTAIRGRLGRFGQEQSPAGQSDAAAPDQELAERVLAARLNTGPEPFGVIRRFPKPMVAVLEGTLSGRGLAIALACDLRIAATSASFAFEEARIGALPEPGVTQLLPRIVGRAVALDLLLTGRGLSALEALEVGLVSRVTDDLEAAVGQLLAKLAAAAPLAARFAKEAIRVGGELPLESGVALELDLSLLLQLTHDRAEGLAAFHERRHPRFSGT